MKCKPSAKAVPTQCKANTNEMQSEYQHKNNPYAGVMLMKLWPDVVKTWRIAG
jgi:hypothetical protein